MFEKFHSSNRQKNEWLLLSASFTVKFEMVFASRQGNVFSQIFHFNVNRKRIRSSEKGTRDFNNSFPFERSACFYVIISGNFQGFHYCNFEINFWKTKTFFEKLEYRTWSTKTPTFPFKTNTTRGQC